MDPISASATSSSAIPGFSPAAQLRTKSVSWYKANVVPLNEQITKAAQDSFGRTTGQIIGTAFKVIPVMIAIVLLPQPAALVGFSICFVVKVLEPSAFKEYPTLSRLCANGMGFYSALLAIKCSFFALEPLYLISMAIHLAITYACFSFIKSLDHPERVRRAHRRVPSTFSSPPPTRRGSHITGVEPTSTALTTTRRGSTSLPTLPGSPSSEEGPDSPSAQPTTFLINVSLSPPATGRKRASSVSASIPTPPPLDE